MADMQLHRNTFYEMGDHTRADLWISDNAVTDKATQAVSLQRQRHHRSGRPHRELKLLTLIAARDAIVSAIAELERVRSRIR